jgi:hypothetical protein
MLFLLCLLLLAVRVVTVDSAAAVDPSISNSFLSDLSIAAVLLFLASLLLMTSPLLLTSFRLLGFLPVLTTPDVPVVSCAALDCDSPGVHAD